MSNPYEAPVEAEVVAPPVRAMKPKRRFPWTALCAAMTFTLLALWCSTENWLMGPLPNAFAGLLFWIAFAFQLGRYR